MNKLELNEVYSNKQIIDYVVSLNIFDQIDSEFLIFDYWEEHYKEDHKRWKTDNSTEFQLDFSMIFTERLNKHIAFELFTK